MFADFIGILERVIEGLGGMPGLLALVGASLTKVFSTQIANGINSVAYSLRSLTPSGKKANADLQA